MKKTIHADIQAKTFDFALSELVRNQRTSFEPMWTVDSWAKFLIWLSLNCGFSGERESLQIFADALGLPLTIRMRKIFFERTLEELGLYILGDPAETKVFVMPIELDQPLIYEKCREALEITGLSLRLSSDSNTWLLHDQLISIPWNSSESG
ncbi:MULTISPECIES: hypothetical protein [unclassified Prochlorococcus]|uniref:hypothetical protein n=1 Tax=unclassified Prochlorococcus TaxID=2627481 RepID=UPI000533AD4F|nr:MULTISPECIES: hypothetical protein [unclassified Prochlorococcus]KGG14539.1 putative Protein phosphatasee 2A regulatory B [Prochlorococcus sp. MIT 0602]KGG16036.1 putative Protein phosphatasee 2A regulatory B [Prochlorococcus sp. MIT 0603]